MLAADHELSPNWDEIARGPLQAKASIQEVKRPHQQNISIDDFETILFTVTFDPEKAAEIGELRCNMR